MAGLPAKRAATYEDLLAVADHLVAEIVDGELLTSPRPTLRHAGASTSLLFEVSPFDRRRGAGGPGGWLFLVEPELHVAGQILVPDVAGWRDARLPELPDAAYLEVAPDWICEILSPRTAALDRTRKMHHYARAGVGHLWLLDPQVETLEDYRLEAGIWQVAASFAGGTKVCAEPFESLEVDLARIWAR